MLESALLGKTFTSVETYYQSYGVVLAVLIAGVGLVAVAFGAARLIAPRRPVGDKLLTYECGIDPVGEGWSQSQVRYYVYGFLFVANTGYLTLALVKWYREMRALDATEAR